MLGFWIFLLIWHLFLIVLIIIKFFKIMIIIINIVMIWNYWIVNILKKWLVNLRIIIWNIIFPLFLLIVRCLIYIFLVFLPKIIILIIIRILSIKFLLRAITQILIILLIWGWVILCIIVIIILNIVIINIIFHGIFSYFLIFVVYKLRLWRQDKILLTPLLYLKIILIIIHCVVTLPLFYSRALRDCIVWCLKNLLILMVKLAVTYIILKSKSTLLIL